MNKIDAQNYSIDPEAGTVTYWTDKETGRQETASIGDLVELLIWLKSREYELRKIVFKDSPLTIRRPMQLVNGYYIGVTEDRRAVKVSAARWAQVMEETERLVRRNWAEDQNDARRVANGSVDVIQLDHMGKPMYQSLKQEVVTEADTPLFLINEHLYKRQTPEFWVDRLDNLDYGKIIKLP